VYYQVMYEFQGGVEDQERQCDWHFDRELRKYVRFEHFRLKKGHNTIQVDGRQKGIRIRFV
jgi:hypothetical protein